MRPKRPGPARSTGVLAARSRLSGMDFGLFAKILCRTRFTFGAMPVEDVCAAGPRMFAMVLLCKTYGNTLYLWCGAGREDACLRTRLLHCDTGELMRSSRYAYFGCDVERACTCHEPYHPP